VPRALIGAAFHSTIFARPLGIAIAMASQAHAVATTILAILTLDAFLDAAINTSEADMALAANAASFCQAVTVPSAVVEARPVVASSAREAEMAGASFGVLITGAMATAFIGASFDFTFGSLPSQVTIAGAVHTLAIFARRCAGNGFACFAMPTVAAFALVVMAATMTRTHAFVSGWANLYRAIDATPALVALTVSVFAKALVAA